MPRTPKEDPEILRAALVGLQHSLSMIDQRIADLRSQLGGRRTSHPSPAASGEVKRVLSPAARRRIALAQKKRWAAFKAGRSKTAQAKPAAAKAPKRALSAEGRARIVAATKKRWAAFRKAQKTAKVPAKTAKKSVARKSAPPAEPAAAATAAPAAE